VDLVVDEDLQQLKRICQAWLMLDDKDKEYAINHAESNKGSCPICKRRSKKF
jgi:hypothetical protein